MFFNRKGINQKNWRMIKKGKHFLFGCTLFLATGAVTIQNPHLVHADEMVASLNDSTKVKDEDPNSDKIPNDVENHPQVENQVKELDKIFEHVSEDKSVEKIAENPVKIVDKTTLNELIEKIRNTDLQNKTAESVERLNLSLLHAQAVLDKAGASQDEIDKEVQVLSDSFAQLEEKSNDIDKKEKQADKANDSDEKKNLLTEKIAKVQALVSEINQLAGEISYEFSESESKSLQVFADLSEGKATESEVDGALNEAKSLRNKVANRVTRAQSGKRDPRNGKPIDGKGESGFRAIEIKPLLIKSNGVNINSNSTNIVAYNSDDFLALMQLTASKGRGDTNRGFYLVNKVTVTSNILTDLQIQVSTNKRGVVTDPKMVRDINIPSVQAAIVGKIGGKGLVKPGTYQFGLTVNDSQHPNRNYQITYNITVKPQSERNTVKDLSRTYVDDVRHLTETEKTALINKFKSEHPDVINRKDGLNNPQVDFDHAEVSADGETMTIHFKDGFATKTIQTNATNDVEAKHSNLTAYFGDSKELYTNPRELVRSKTGHEVPTTAQVTYKTPFNLQEAGTRNVVVTTTYENGVTKDVTTPYTVLDFIGKQDKKINQNQSGELGDARNYVTVSDNSAVPGELTVRWKGGSSNVDTSAAGVQHKEIEILRGSHLMKTVNVPVEIVDNIKPTITAPDNITLTRLEGLPSEINIHAQDNDKGVGLKESNSVTVDNLPNPLSYNAKKSKIEINGVIPNNFQLGKSSIQVTVKAVDKKENTATKNITFHIQSQTQKYTAVANSQIQEVSYGEAPDAGTSIQKNGLPTGTRYGWATQPNTATGPGDQTEVVTVTYPDGSTDTVPVTVKVRKLSDEHIPTGKTITVNQNDPVTNDRLKAAVTVDNGGTRKVKSVTAAPISTVHAGSQTIKATVTYLDNTTDPVDIPLEVKDVTPPTIQTPAENTNWEVTALDKALPNMEVRAEDNENGSGIKNVTVTGLPDYLDYDSPTHTIKFKSGKDAVEKLAGNTPSQEFTLNIRAEDKAGNVSERTAKITVSSMSAKTNPTPIPQNTSYGQVPDSNASVDKAGLPDGTKVTWKTPPVVNTPGTTTGVAEVTYPDGSKDVVTVNVTVRKVSEDFTATGTQIEVNQNVSVTPEMLKGAVTATNAQGENGNSKIATVESKTPINTEAYGDQTIQAKVTYIDGSEQPDTSKPGSKTGKVLITYPDHSTEEVTVTVNVTPQNDEYTPTGIPQEVDNGHVPDPETSVTKTGLPEGTTVTWKTRPDVSTPGSHPGVALVHYPDGTEDEVEVPVTVKKQSDTFNPTAKEPNQTAKHGSEPSAEGSINTDGLPKGTSYTWVEKPDTNTTPGNKPGKVLITYPDKSTEEVTVTVEVTPQKDDYDPQPKTQTVEHAQVPSAKDSIENVKTLPEGTTFVWKGGKIPDTSKHGEKKGVVTVTYPDGSTEDVNVVITVNPEDFSPVVPMEKVPVKNPENLSPEEQDKVKEKVTKANPGKDVTVDSKGNVTITDPETKVSHKISRDKLVFAYAKGEPETSKIPEFNGGVNAPNSPTHEVPEFNGGVNGELPDPVEVPKVQLIITKWVDENGKELKPADAKAPKVLGEKNEAFEHGEIPGYVFVRTETKGDVVTHVFRKVSPVRPTGDGQQRPAAPSYDTNPRPDIATPAEVPATQPDGQSSQTVEVPAQLPNEVSETNPSVSQPQAVLPNTGTQEDRATGALGVLSLLGAFGLLFAKKKKDDEEEA